MRLEAQIQDRAFIDLLLEFWILGRHHPKMRSRFQDAMVKYRERFCITAQQMIREDKDKLSKLSEVTAESVAIFASSLVIGNVLQGMFDPEKSNTEALLSVTKILFAE